ncbi:hypothetical protein QWY20_04405 [Alkalimonas sp. MEB108]|uniref:Uncharacterized protein n=1 Tax=Alkalimonas cellulosilytica TaxID=3058395 RepID=A0ABU7J2F8_9GAMM|nr:hypothetical protein [Alkalimonas sp. MEB108]MEE2000685.1 hypothetical protein [Alkalimonas sp. MEB108]
MAGGWLLIIFAVALYVLCYKMNSKVMKYEFENRTSGGVVEFATFEESISHERRKRVARLLFSVATFLLLIGILIVA